MIDHLLRRLRDERGIALVMAMGILLVMSIALTGVIYFTATNTRSSAYAKEEQAAVGLAEAGVNNALAALHDLDPVEGIIEPNALQPPRTTTYPGGSVTWFGELMQECDSSDPPLCRFYWMITATGTVDNPTGPNTNDISRTLSVRVNLKPPPVVDKNIDIWNWVYTEGTGKVCDMTIDQGVDMYAPLYVKGNLCMRSTAKVHTGPLVVGGNLSLSEPQTAVGSQAKPLTEKVRVVGWCQWWNKAAAAPQCQPGAQTNIWTTDFGTTLSPFSVSLPPVWWGGGEGYPYLPLGHEDEDGWYEMASPGPALPCREATGTPPTFDTGDSALNHSVPGEFNLTPAARSYFCKTKRGQLSWDHTTRRLTLRGVIFIDGDVKIENNTGVIVYQQERPCGPDDPLDARYCDRGAVIYLGGGLAIKNSVVCAKQLGTGCDTRALAEGGWNPNENLLVFAAFDQGRYLKAGNGIEVVSATFQGALYARHAIQTSTTSTTQGPLVSETEVKLGQTNGADFPPILINPVGMPGFGPEFWSIENPQVG